MVREFRRTSAPGGPWYEFYSAICPICHNDGMCMIHEDGNRVVCCREESEIAWAKDSALPGWLHFLEDNYQKFEKIDINAEADNPKKEDKELDRIFRAFIAELNLTKEHALMLTGPTRQMTLKEILANKYRSFPEKPWDIAKKVVERLGGTIEDLIGVPGFHLKEGKYGQYLTIKGMKNSILIPFRNTRNQIVGFQYRVDEVRYKTLVNPIDKTFSAFIKEQPNHVVVKLGDEVLFDGEMEIKKEWETFKYNDKVVGAVRVKKGQRYMWLSSQYEEGGTGAGPLPVHIAVPSDEVKDWKIGTVLQRKTVWITEGPLKADISANRLTSMLSEQELATYGNTLLSIPGVNSWRLILPILEEMGVEHVVMAWDMDATIIPEVKAQLIECLKTLQDQNYTIDMAYWDIKKGKGIDDLLLTNDLPTFKRMYTKTQETKKAN